MHKTLIKLDSVSVRVRVTSGSRSFQGFVGKKKRRNVNVCVSERATPMISKTRLIKLYISFYIKEH